MSVKGILDGPTYSVAGATIKPLQVLYGIARSSEPEDVTARAIANAVMIEHADQERIAKALEALLGPLCDIANAITSYQGRH